jgi:hypothetical protein
VTATGLPQAPTPQVSEHSLTWLAGWQVSKH